MFMPAIRAIVRSCQCPVTRAPSASLTQGKPGNLSEKLICLNALNRSDERSSSALALLVARVRADDTHDSLAPDDLALAADFFYRSHHFHCHVLFCASVRNLS